VPQQPETPVLNPRILDRISRLDVRARLIVEGFISGLHKSPYHGHSVEFAEHREYVPGDEIKHIDWRVWARSDRYVVKQYEEETNLRCQILLDCSRSMAYGRDGGPTKFDHGCTLAACLAYLLHRQQDAAGLVLFDRAVRQSLPCSAHPRHLKHLFHELERCAADHESDVSEAFVQAVEQNQRRGLVVLISDLFVEEQALATFLTRLRYRRQETIVFHVLDPDELTFPFRENTLFRGLEVSQELLAEPAALRRSYLEALERFRRRVSRLCAETAADYVLVDTGQPLEGVLARYLNSRQRMRHTFGRR